jgi:hypothetical protein
MPDVGVVVTSHKHGGKMRRRAATSAAGQSAKPYVEVRDAAVYGGPNIDCIDSGFASWLIGAISANTEYVAVLHDDDWYEPTFISRCVEMMAPDVAYVFTQATIHFPDGTTRPNWGDPPAWGPTGYLDSRETGLALALSTAVISPSCVLYRRADLLRCIVPGGAPGLPHNNKFCGPDLLMCLLPLLDYPRVGWIADPLVNFDGHDESTTIAEMKRDGGKDLQVNYNSARLLYLALRQVRDQLDGDV